MVSRDDELVALVHQARYAQDELCDYWAGLYARDVAFLQQEVRRLRGDAPSLE